MSDMSSIDDLIAFLNARLDEDRAVAREAAGLTECWVAEEPAIGVVLVDGEPLIEGHIVGLTAHIARHDPARVRSRPRPGDHQQASDVGDVGPRPCRGRGWR